MNEIFSRKESTMSAQGVVLLAIGWTTAIASLLFYPFIFGLVGVVCGILSTKAGSSKSGIYLIAASIVMMGLGLMYSDVIINYAGRYFSMKR